MLYRPLLEPDTPEWLVLSALIAGVGSILVLLIWSMVLEIKYIGPYTLVTTPSKEKWRRAILLVLLQTGVIPILGLMEPALTPYPHQWPVIPLYGAGIWIVLLPFAILYKKWEFERHLRNYKHWNEHIQSGAIGKIFSSPFIGWTRIFMSKEFKRFLKEGYSEKEIKL